MVDADDIRELENHIRHLLDDAPETPEDEAEWLLLSHLAEAGLEARRARRVVNAAPGHV